MYCALACVARGPIVSAVCLVVGLSRSYVLTKKTRSTDLSDLRELPPKSDDADLKDDIACVVKYRATYGSLRGWPGLKIDGRQINHKRVYRVMRERAGCCLSRTRNPRHEKALRHSGRERKRHTLVFRCIKTFLRQWRDRKGGNCTELLWQREHELGGYEQRN